MTNNYKVGTTRLVWFQMRIVSMGTHSTFAVQMIGLHDFGSTNKNELVLKS